MLKESTLFGEVDKVKNAIELLRQHEPPEGYYLCNSGGKDSAVIHHLAEKAKVKFHSHYNITTVDPPELVKHLKKHYPNTIWERPILTMWQLIEKNGPPTRLFRFCCKYLKEHGGDGQIKVTGIRAEESIRRKKTWGFFTPNIRGGLVLNPIFDWREYEVWEYIDKHQIPYCSLYDEGYSRLGCIGCPQKNTKGIEADFKRYPHYRTLYLRAFQRFIDYKKTRGWFDKWKTPEEVMNWWLYGNPSEEGELFRE